MNKLKYEYYLYTWGGFYNQQYKDIHQEEPKAKWFNTLEKRSEYINKLKKIEEELQAKHLCIITCEGYFTRTPVILHRVSKYKNKIVKTTNELWPDTSYDGAKYILQWKWYPGCNDYPFGEDFDYENNKKFEIIQEWIEGCFDLKEDN